jgi:hypothetical protein
MNKLLIRCFLTMPLAVVLLYFASGYMYPENRVFAGYGQIAALIAAVVGYAFALGGQGILYGDSLSKNKKRIADWLRVAMELFAVIYLSLASEFRESLVNKFLVVVFIVLIVLDVLRLVWVQRAASKGAGSP